MVETEIMPFQKWPLFSSIHHIKFLVNNSHCKVIKVCLIVLKKDFLRKRAHGKLDLKWVGPKHYHQVSWQKIVYYRA